MKSDIRATLFGQEAAVNSLVDKGKRDGVALSSLLQKIIDDPFFLAYWKMNKAAFLTSPQIITTMGIPIIPWGYYHDLEINKKSDVLKEFLNKYLENKEYFSTYTGNKIEELISACDFLLSHNSEGLPNFIAHGIHIIIEPSLRAIDIMGGRIRADKGISFKDDKRLEESLTGGVKIKFFAPYCKEVQNYLFPFTYPFDLSFRKANLAEALTTLTAWTTISPNLGPCKDHFRPKHLKSYGIPEAYGYLFPKTHGDFQIKTQEDLVVIKKTSPPMEMIVSEEENKDFPTYLLGVSKH